MSETPTPKEHASPTDAPQATTITTVRTQRPTVNITVPDGWARGLLTGIETSLMGWALATLISVLAYWSVANNPWMTNTSWSDAMSAGATLWASTLGAKIHITTTLDNEEIALYFRTVPLLLTLGTIAAMRALLLSGRRFPPAAHFFAIPGFITMNAILISANRGWVHWPTNLLGMSIIAAIACTWAYTSDRQLTEEPTIFQRLTPTHAPAIHHGLRTGVNILSALAGIATVILTLAVIIKWSAISGIVEVLQPQNAADTALIIIGQLLFIPNAIAWVLGWVSGAGIAVGADAIHSIGSSTIAPIPPIPLLGVLPSTAYGYGWITLSVILSLIAGGVWGKAVKRESSLICDLISQGVTLATFYSGLLVWMSASTLTLGVDRLSHVGPYAFTAAALTTCEIALPLCVAYIATHPDSVRTATHYTHTAYMTLAQSSVGKALHLPPITIAPLQESEPTQVETPQKADETTPADSTQENTSPQEDTPHTPETEPTTPASTIDHEAETVIIDTAQYVADPD